MLRYLITMELLRFIRSPLLYVLISGYLFLSGILFFSILQSVFMQDSSATISYNAAIIQPIIESQAVILLFVFPFVSMRGFSEERYLHSMLLLDVSGVSSLTLCLSKLISHWLILLSVIVVGASFPLSMCIIGEPEVLPVVLGVVGLGLFSLVLSSMGVLISCVSSNPIVVAILSLSFGLLWYLLDQVIPTQGIGGLAYVQEFMLAEHLSQFVMGVFSLVDVYFFLGVTVLFAYGSILVLDYQRS